MWLGMYIVGNDEIAKYVHCREVSGDYHSPFRCKSQILGFCCYQLSLLLRFENSLNHITDYSIAGGHLGRFIVWTKSAFEKLDTIFGTHEKKSLVKKDYVLPRNIMGNPDLGRIINSDEIQSVVRPTKVDIKRRALKKNPLKNLGALLKLNPYAKTARRMELLSQERQAKAKAEKLQSKRSQLKVLHTFHVSFLQIL